MEDHMVFDYMGKPSNWSHSFTIITVDEKGDWFNEPVHIKKGKAYYNGVFYEP
jgi:hypothetical protein